MPLLPHQVTPVETLLPSVDHRNAARSFVVDGRNFLFDSKGPKSGFTSRMLTPFPLESPHHVQGLTIQNRTFVMTQDAILAWRTKVPFTWELLYGFNSEISADSDGPWSALFLEAILYLAHPGRGLFAGALTEGEDQILFQPKTDSTTPGLILNIRGMAVVRGRPILVNDEEIQWGAVGNMENFTPALGGAGLQVLAAFVQGDYLGLSSWQDGFVVWTTGGPVVGEYIGGDSVWHFYPMTNREQPISRRAVHRMTNGNIVFMTRKGLFITNGIGEISPFSPEFNEFFLGYTEREDGQLTEHQFWRLDYDENREILFLAESTDGVHYWRAFVFTPTRDKWGLFSNVAHGFLPFTNDTYGYVDQEGYCHYFTPTLQIKEGLPDNSLGYNRHMPRHQKATRTPSSSLVSRAYVDNPATPTTALSPPAAAWYENDGQSVKRDYPVSLDSWIEIGYVRPQQLQGLVDDVIEIQEMKVSSIPSSPSFDPDFRSNHHKTDFYGTEEDWNSLALSLADDDITEDCMFIDDDTDDEDWLIDVGDSEDFNLLMGGTVVFAIESEEDWNLLSGTEDWGGLASGLNPITYDIEVRASQDGITFDTSIPQMARFDIAAQSYVGLPSGAFNRIRLSAAAPYQYYWASYISVAIQYQGKLL